MTIQIDKLADAAYIRFAEGTPFESQVVGEGVVLDFDQSGQIIAIELLGVSHNMPGNSLSRVEVVTN